MATPVAGSSRSTGGFRASGGAKKASAERRKKKKTALNLKAEKSQARRKGTVPLTERRAKAKEILAQHADKTKRIGELTAEQKFAKEFFKKHGEVPQMAVPATPATAEQLAENQRQAEQRGQLGVETQQLGTREEVQALEDREGIETQPIQQTPEFEENAFEGLTSEGKPTPEEVKRLQKATLGGLSFGIPLAGILTKVRTTGTALLASRGLNIPSVSNAATGLVSKIRPGFAWPALSKIQTGLARQESAARLAKATGYIQSLGKPSWNTVTAAKVTAYIGKAVSHLRDPAAAAGIVGTTVGFWGLGEWGKAEGSEGLGFQYAKAKEKGFNDLAAEIEPVLDDALNPPMWESIIAILPLFQLPITVKRIGFKVEAARAMKRVTDRESERIASGELSPEEAYWQGVEESKQRAKEEERKDDEAYWTGIQKDRTEAKAIERAVDEAYWANIKNGADKK